MSTKKERETYRSREGREIEERDRKREREKETSDQATRSSPPGRHLTVDVNSAHSVPRQEE